MTTILASTLFSVTLVGDAFDHAIDRDAANGRVNAALIGCLESAYGLALPASPTPAVKVINEFLALEKSPKLASGPGATATTVAVVRVLRNLAQALYEGGRVKGLKAPAPLPNWADEAAIAAKKEAAKAAKAAKAASEGVAPLDTVPARAQSVQPEVAAPTAAAIAAAVNLVTAAAVTGSLTGEQKGRLIAALEGAAIAPF